MPGGTGAWPDGGNGTDFVVAIVRDEGRWSASVLPPRIGGDLDALVAALRQEPSDVGTLGFVSVAEDFFVAARATVSGRPLLLVSDAAAATESHIGRQVLERLRQPVVTEEEVMPAGDLAMFSDLGMDSRELEALLADLELFPDEMLAGIANRLGFGEEFERAVDDATD
jgi:putative tRNA adenosine deaminase-associated protein